MRLQYIGSTTVMFTHPAVGEVEPGAEFLVPDGDADALLARADVVKAPTRVKARTSKPSVKTDDETVTV